MRVYVWVSTNSVDSAVVDGGFATAVRILRKIRESNGSSVILFSRWKGTSV